MTERDMKGAPAEVPKCDKCGLEITTGMMVCACPHHEQCAFWCEDWSDETKDAVRLAWQRGSILDALL